MFTTTAEIKMKTQTKHKIYIIFNVVVIAENELWQKKIYDYIFDFAIKRLIISQTVILLQKMSRFCLFAYHKTVPSSGRAHAYLAN